MKKQQEDDFIEILTDKYINLKVEKNSINELDLGCGVGSFTAALAKKYENYNIFAADVMIGRLRKLVKRNKRMEINNMKLLRVEAGNLISYMLPDESFDRIHLLCPDPWPKEKHRANRLICSNFVSKLHRVLKLGGTFHFSSDDVPYFDAVVEIINGSGIFQEDISLIDDIKDVKSDFELRWLGQDKKVRHAAWKSIKRQINVTLP